MPDVKNAELIEGVVYMASPVSSSHSNFDMLVHTWLGTYEWATPGCSTGCNGTWRMLEDVPQPDVHLRLLAECGGRSWIEEDYFVGAPEVVVEVSASSTAIDLGPKLNLYERAGVLEYVTVLLRAQQVVWRYRAGKRFVQLRPGADGLLRSRVFPGLWLDPAALLAADKRKLLSALRRGLRSPEHLAFKRELRSRRSGARP